MGETEFGVNHAGAVKLWSPALAVEAENKQYFKKFMGTGEDSMIKIQSELSKKEGDRIRVGLRMKLSGDGIEGDNAIEGTSAEEALEYFYCDVLIDQRRKGTKSKGKMSEQRVPYNIRKHGMDALSTWFAEDYDQLIMIYLSGSRGFDTSFHVPLGFTGRANNTVANLETGRIIYGGTASAITEITAQDKMSISLVEKCNAFADTVDPMIQPFMINGEKKFVLLMHTFQKYDLRTSVSDNDWLRIHRDIDDKTSPIYQNALGEYGGVILHDHRNVIQFNTTTTPATSAGITAARALFLGAQAGIIAFGGATDMNRYSWHEETDDRGNQLVITGGSIWGCVRSTFDHDDDGTAETFGLIGVDTYAKDPNA